MVFDVFEYVFIDILMKIELIFIEKDFIFFGG